MLLQSEFWACDLGPQRLIFTGPWNLHGLLGKWAANLGKLWAVNEFFELLYGAVPGVASSGGGQGGEATLKNGINASHVNSFRISAVIDCLALHVRSHHKGDAVEFLNLCLSLARGIDFAIANHEVPSRAEELPSLVKQVCQCKNDTLLLAAITVLMISIKNACQSGWFPDRDSEELINLTKEIANNFDSKNLMSSPGDKIRLFVAQTYSIETSYCLISPPKVNFLLNGKAVERRSSLVMDTGPQIPTAVTHLLKYGLNLLQAVGEFNGNYLVVVAVMSEMPKADSNALQDYEQHAPSTVDSDFEIIEEPSRISLNCPISIRRIRTPVKGHSCKHIQCFDFDNYVDINSRRPSWRCPHCNQHVCFADIRIDQKMVKKPEKKTSITKNNDSLEPVDVLDLTQTDDAMDNTITCETEDRKLSQTACQSQSVTQTMAVNPIIANTNYVNTSSTDVEYDFWSGVYLSTFGLASSNFPSSELLAAVSVSTSNFIASPPGLTDSFVSPNGEVEAFPGNSLMPAFVPQSEASLPNTSQLQQCQFGNATITNEYRRLQSILRHITRIPSAVQALPAQASSSVLQQMSRDNVNALIHNGFSAASQASPASPMISNPVLHPNPLQLSQMSSSPLHHYPRIQQTRPFPYVSPPQQNINFQASRQVPNAPRVLNQRSSQQITNFMMPRSMSQSLDMNISSIQSPASLLRTQSDVGVSQDRIVHTTELVSGQHPPRTALAEGFPQ
ncbi:UNVERIFIED_CONTAM: E4 SUMO-protein ligase PIAL2 [Sesamum indicum]